MIKRVAGIELRSFEFMSEHVTACRVEQGRLPNPLVESPEQSHRAQPFKQRRPTNRCLPPWESP